MTTEKPALLNSIAALTPPMPPPIINTPVAKTGTLARIVDSLLVARYVDTLPGGLANRDVGIGEDTGFDDATGEDK
jgi:hypothetical protein